MLSAAIRTIRNRSPTAVRYSYTNFKYWFDDPFRCNEFTGDAKKIRESKALNGHEDMESGQDMTYWSENHRILFAAAEYLAGQFWPEDQFVSQRANRKEGANGPLAPGDMTGRQHQAHAKRRVLRWLNERLRLGFAEWNAPGYYVEDLLALVNLADFAVDPEIRTRTAMVLDLMVFDLAQNSPTGAFAGSAGRVYFEHKNCVWEQTVRDSAELLFGQLGHFSGSSNAAAFIATSPAYRPPDALIAVARNGPETAYRTQPGVDQLRRSGGLRRRHLDRRRHGVLVESRGLRDQADDHRIASGRHPVRATRLSAVQEHPADDQEGRRCDRHCRGHRSRHPRRYRRRGRRVRGGRTGWEQSSAAPPARWRAHPRRISPR